MKILMFAMEYPPLLGGGGTYVKNLCDGLSSLGVELRLITSGSVDGIETVSKNLDVVRSANLLELYKESGSFLSALDLLNQQIEDFKPDLVHTHHTVEKILFGVINVRHNLPFVATQTRTPGYSGYEKTYSSKQVRYEFSNRLNTDHYICLSEVFMKDLLRCGVNKEIVSVIYPGVNNNDFFYIGKNDVRLNKMKSRIGLNDGEVLIFIPTVIRQRKGVDFTLKAISNISCGKKVKVVLSGLSAVEANEELVMYYKGLTKPNILVEAGSLTVNDMNLMYNIADVVAFGSQGEGLGLVVLESMACQCPVVSTNVNGVNEILVNGVNGLLCEYGDLDAFTKNLAGVLSSPELRKKMIIGGRGTLESKFNTALQAKKHFDIYTKVIENKKL